jgi:riboflavin synthase
MFTGLVQAVGRLQTCPGGVAIHFSPGALGTLTLGDSIAVDGVCLTVAELWPDGFRADVSGETLGRSTLALKARQGGSVNLEPALRLADRLGGHLVSGHVDGLGRVVLQERRGPAWHLELAWEDAAYGRYICEKASITVDGISLTVAGCSVDGARFWIAVIPHTWASTTLKDLRGGSAVNLEADLLAKYTERLLQARSEPHGPGYQQGKKPAASALDSQWLSEQGYG